LKTNTDIVETKRCLSMKGKLDVDSLLNAVIERMMYLKAIPYGNPPFAMCFLTIGQNKQWK
jgi:hypothetical protein